MADNQTTAAEIAAERCEIERALQAIDEALST
jgi:hypothetical protein